MKCATAPPLLRGSSLPEKPSTIIYLAGERLPFRVVSAMYDQLITELKYLSANFASVATNRHRGRARSWSSFSVAGFDVKFVQLNLLHDRRPVLYRSHGLSWHRPANQRRTGGYFALEFAKHFVVGQQLVYILDVYLRKMGIKRDCNNSSNISSIIDVIWRN